MDQKILILAAALAILFLPQSVQLFTYFKNKVIGVLPILTTHQPSEEVVDTHPAVWVNDLFALQQILLSNDRKDAADLVGQAIVKLVNTSASRTGGSRR